MISSFLKKYLSKKILEPSTDCDTTATKSSCSDFSINSQSLTTINNNVCTPALNFSSGTSQACLDAIIKDSDLQKARERIKENLNNGKSIKEQLREAKRITSGIVFKCNTTCLGQTVFDACRENQMKKNEIERQKIRKEK